MSEQPMTKKLLDHTKALRELLIEADCVISNIDGYREADYLQRLCERIDTELDSFKIDQPPEQPTSNERVNPHSKWLRELASHMRADHNWSSANTCDCAADEIDRLQAGTKMLENQIAILGDRLRTALEPAPAASKTRLADGALDALILNSGVTDFGSPLLYEQVIMALSELRDLRRAGNEPCHDCDLYCHCLNPIESTDSNLVCGNCGKPFHEAQRASQPPRTNDPDMRHPKIQALIGGQARLGIELRIIESMLEPDWEADAIDGEYWTPLHDKLQQRLSQQPADVQRDAERLKTYFEHANAITHPSLWYSSFEPFNSWRREIDDYERERADVAGSTNCPAITFPDDMPMSERYGDPRIDGSAQGEKDVG
jgi:hypothetical protein